MNITFIGGLLKRDFTAAQLRAVEINADNRARLQQAFVSARRFLVKDKNYSHRGHRDHRGKSVSLCPL